MDSSQIDLPPLDISGLLYKHDLHPKKNLGQNFLVDQTALRRIISCAEIPPLSEILEIGPGLGSLTRYLALKSKRVVAVEIDRNFLPVLSEVLQPFQNVQIIQSDILKLEISSIMKQPGYLVIANIPYYITSAVIRHLLESSIRPSRIVLTVQNEVAERICAKPGDLSLLALSVQVYGLPRIAARIPAGAFYPPPKVDSAVVRVDLFAEPIIPESQLDAFFRLIKAGFSQKRKMLRNSVAAGLGWNNQDTSQLLESAGIDPQRRAETVNLEEWKLLTQVFASGER